MPEDEKEPPLFMNGKTKAQMLGAFHAQRRVLVNGALTMPGLVNTGLELLKLDMESSEPITILLSSGGGNVVATHQLEDMINSVNSPIDVIAVGNCCSMAVDLMQMCRKRMMLPSAQLLVHYVRHEQKWICDDFERLERDIAYFRDRIKEMGRRRMALYQKRTGLSEKEIQDMFRHGEVHEAFFSAKQALEMKLIDEILTDFKYFPNKDDKK